MAKLSVKDVLKLAALSKLELTEDELIEFTQEINDIIKYVDQLGDVDVDGLEPTSQVTGLTNVMRKDEVINYSAKSDDLLKNVPNVENNYIKVKRTLN
jgi:aspartyl-tRNA(Asn)/glutamyl-tRNA(Gln) amidotransferase subunit C